MNKTVALVFSYSRPMQLSLTLQSLVQKCTGYSNLDVKVLYKADDERMNNAYLKVAEENPTVEFIKEVSFHTNINVAIINYQFTMFVTDDTVFTNPFSIAEITDTIVTQKTLGFSLRLGKNTEFCYPIDKKQAFPVFFGDKNIILWDWTKAEFDWNYPLEVSSSVYRTWDILRIVNACFTNNPNQFESAMDTLKKHFVVECPWMACHDKSVAVALPINKIRPDNMNRSGTNPEYSVESLLTKFENGGRIKPNQFDGFISNAAHQEVLIDFIYHSNLS
jgi:hypothetical protein